MAAVRELIAFECTECKRKNYTSTKNRKKTTDKLPESTSLRLG